MFGQKISIKQTYLKYSQKYQTFQKTTSEREYIIQEMFEKEKSFNKIFNHFIKNYYLPLVNSMHSDVLPKGFEKKLIIPGLLDIYYFLNHQHGILNQFGEILQQQDSNVEVGALFLKIIPYFQLYTPYIVHFKEIISRFYSFKKKFSSFSLFLKDSQENDVELQGKSFEDILSFPFQRMCHYELFLERLGSKTTFEHKDKVNLCLAIKEMKKVKTSVNSNCYFIQHSAEKKKKFVK
jgi:hypothetical protein